MAIKKIFYNGKCVLTIDMDFVKEDAMYEALDNLLGMFKERAFEEFHLEEQYEAKVKSVWHGYEYIYELKNQVEKELEKEFEDEPFQKIEQLYSIMEEKLNDEEYEIFKKLRSEDVGCYNKLEGDFYAGAGCLDYVWVECNGKKSFLL